MMASTQLVNQARTLFALLVVMSLWTLCAASVVMAEEAEAQPPAPVKQTIGPDATIVEAETKLPFRARVDTGATTCSIHSPEWKIPDESKKMQENIGKPIKFRIDNGDGKTAWIKGEIAQAVKVKTSEEAERRYKVKMALRYNEVTKEVLVTLNDRSQMNYPLLIGRNFLSGDFVVDVEDGRSSKPRLE